MCISTLWPLGVLSGKSKRSLLFNSTVSTCQDQGESSHVDSLPFYVTHYHLNATRVPQCSQCDGSRGWMSEAGHEKHFQPKIEPSADEGPLTDRKPGSHKRLIQAEGEVNQIISQHWAIFVLTNISDCGRKTVQPAGRGTLRFMTQEETGCIPQWPSSQQPCLISECALSPNCSCKTPTPFIFNVQ